MLIDAEIRARARENQKLLEAIGRRSREFAAACVVGSFTLAPTAPLAAAAAFVSILSFEAARAKGRIADDPPRPDFETRTHRRRRPISTHLLLPELEARNRAATLLAEVGGLLVEEESYATALVRSFERAAGAFGAGSTLAAEERVAETRRFALGASRALVDIAETASTAATDLARISLTPTESQSVQGKTLEEILPSNALAALYRAGITIDEVRYAVLDDQDGSTDQLALAADLGDLSRAARGLADVMRAWDPESDARKVRTERGWFARYEVFIEPGGRLFRWRLVARDGRTLAVSQEAFPTRGDARHAAEEVKRSSGAPIVER